MFACARKRVVLVSLRSVVSLMSSKKTSFKQLLAKGASNPRVNVQSVRDQRERLDSLKRGAPSTSAAQPPSKRPAVSAPAPPALPAPSSRGSGTPPTSFVPAPTFAGPRPGFVYKSGPRGVGYYAEGTLLAPGAQPQSAPKPFAVKPSFSAIAAEEEEEDDGEAETQTTPEAAAAVAAGSATLPTDFFDNPQQDPSNRAKAKEMASTRKEQQMRDEMEEFQRSVASDLAAADAADAVDEEDDVDAAAREEAYVEHDMRQRVGQLKERRAEALARLPAAAAVGSATGGGAADGAAGTGADKSENDDDDDDDDDIDLQAALDWRAKAF